MQEHKEAYLNSRERMNPELEEKLKSNTTELAKNPAFPKTDKDGNPINFLELIAYKRFNDTVAKVKKYTNVDGVSSNIGLAKHRAAMLGEGDWLVELDHDDYLTNECLLTCNDAINKFPDGKFLYTNCAEKSKIQEMRLADSAFYGCTIYKI